MTNAPHAVHRNRAAGRSLFCIQRGPEYTNLQVISLSFKERGQRKGGRACHEESEVVPDFTPLHGLVFGVDAAQKKARASSSGLKEEMADIFEDEMQERTPVVGFLLYEKLPVELRQDGRRLGRLGGIVHDHGERTRPMDLRDLRPFGLDAHAGGQILAQRIRNLQLAVRP